MLRPIARHTLTDQAAQTIKSLILRENLEPGTRLPTERDLAETFMVSRNIVREALSALAAEGIVSREVGKGTFVRKLDNTRITDTLHLTVEHNGATPHALREARLALEIGALEYAVPRITNEQIAELEAIVAAHERQWLEGQPGVKEDIDFHITLLKATGSPILIDMSPLVIDGLREGMIDAPTGMFQINEHDIIGHRALLVALKQRDLDQARDIMRAHITLTRFPRNLIPDSELMAS